MKRFYVILGLIILNLCLLSVAASADEPKLKSIDAENYNTEKSTVVTIMADNSPDMKNIAVKAEQGQFLYYNDIELTDARCLAVEISVDAKNVNKNIEIYIDGIKDENRIAVLNTGNKAKVNDLDFNEKYAPLAFNAAGSHDLIFKFAENTEIEMDWFKPTSYTGEETEAERDERMKWWRDAKFGQFIHFGAYSYLGGIYQGKVYTGNLGYSEWIMEMGISKADYRNNVAAKFNPENFDAKQIVQDAKAAGQKYLVITSRHHEGFSIFDTKIRNYKDYSLFSVSNNGNYAGPDILKELSEECEKEGIVFGVYTTILDWQDPSQEMDRTQSYIGATKILPGYTKEEYKAQLKGQLKELIEDYGVKIFFFDGDWSNWWTREDGREVYRCLLSLDESVIINDRVGKRHREDGDYGTPEQYIPATGLGYDWESNVTMNGSWGYRIGDNNWKSTEWIVTKVIDVASKGGNLLLNVGPDGDGKVEEAPIERMREAGKWFRKFGDAIYGTRANCFTGTIPSDMRVTTKEGKVYLSLIGSDPSERGKVIIPRLKNEINEITEMASGKEIGYEIMGNSIVIDISGAEKQDYATVFEIDVEGIPQEKIPGDEFVNKATGATAAAKTEFGTSNSASAVNDSNKSTRWAPKDEDKNPWIQLDFGKEEAIKTIVLYEWLDNFYSKDYRSESFTISASNDGNEWFEIYQGGRINEKLSVTLDEIIYARYIKVHNFELRSGAKSWPSLYEIEVYDTIIEIPEIEINEINTVTEGVPFTAEGTYANGERVAVEVWNKGTATIVEDAVINNGKWSAEIDIDALYSDKIVVTVYLYDEEDNAVAVDSTNVGNVVVYPKGIEVLLGGEVIDGIILAENSSAMLNATLVPEGAKGSFIWKTDSIANGVILPDGTLKVYNPGKFNIEAVADNGISTRIPVFVTGEGIKLSKADISAVKAADNGYDSGWLPSFAIDGRADSPYASKDDATVKYFQSELAEAAAIDFVCITGRSKWSLSEGAFANRINGAKIYASNTPWNGVESDCVLVGEVEGVTATSEHIPALIAVDTKGEKYKYYTLLLDKKNNGSYISFGLDEIAFYEQSGYFGVKIISEDEKSVTIKTDAAIAGKYNLILGVYDGNELSEAVTKEVRLDGESSSEIVIDKTKSGAIKVFLWEADMIPVYSQAEAE